MNEREANLRHSRRQTQKINTAERRQEDAAERQANLDLAQELAALVSDPRYGRFQAFVRERAQFLRHCHDELKPKGFIDGSSYALKKEGLLRQAQILEELLLMPQRFFDYRNTVEAKTASEKDAGASS